VMDLVSEVVTRREFGNGLVSEQFVRWDGASSSFDEIKQNIRYAQEHKVVSFRQKMVLESGAEIHIPILETLHILPDRSGVLVILERNLLGLVFHMLLGFSVFLIMLQSTTLTENYVISSLIRMVKVAISEQSIQVRCPIILIR